ncbi:MAG: ClbS/DfsB family four-helix bundle protein [Nitrososphaerota archaeon]
MSEEALSKEQLLRDFADAYERLMETATDAARQGANPAGDGWGPRDIIAHLAGWEIMATARIPAIVGGMAPMEFAEPAQNQVMNDAINAAFVTLAGDQPLDALCGMLRQAYQRNVAYLTTLDERFFQPGEYVYERTEAVVWHCREHGEMLIAPQP